MHRLSGFAALLPAAVEVEEVDRDDDATTLSGAELAAMREARPERIREFSTTRACARRALQRLGRPIASIPVGAHREPEWPEGVSGSITHCPGLRAAAVADVACVDHLGIDAEPHAPLPAGVLATIARPEEREAIRILTATDPRIAWDRIVFSAKETVFKAWFPATRRWLAHEECIVSIDPNSEGFTARLLADSAHLAVFGADRLRGRWSIEGGFVRTATARIRD